MDEVSSRADERVGRVLDGKWTLERVLGSGGMGIVYEGRHRNGARGAVKVLHPDLGRHASVRERFLREGYAANRVGHPGAVRVLDDDTVADGPDQGTAYLVMELLDGESLEERLIRGEPPAEPELLKILDDVLAVLEAAHTNGVIHRDLKPANIFLNRDRAGPPVKILDFGLARVAESDPLTSVGLALGTPSYMAPEQASGASDQIDARTDLFSVGATAFMVLAGRGVQQADGVVELVTRMSSLAAPKIRSVVPTVSESAASIIDRALERKREDRFSSATAMRVALAPLLRAAPPSVEPPSVEPAKVEPSVEPDSVAAVPPTTSSSRAHWVLLAFVAAGVLLVAVSSLSRRTDQGYVSPDISTSATEIASGTPPVDPSPEPSAPSAIVRSPSVEHDQNDEPPRDESVDASAPARPAVRPLDGRKPGPHTRPRPPRKQRRRGPAQKRF